ncbi:MAG: glycosyltransferase [Phycisphaerales bacterium]
MRIGYFIPDFPSQTHAFFWRELDAVGRLAGEPVEIVSTTRPADDQCLHDFAEEARGRTTYLLRTPELLRGVLTAVGLPLAALRGFRAAMRLQEISPGARLGAWLAALRLVTWARHHRLDHLHVHSAANAALIAMLARIMGGPSYSVVLHGDPEVYGSHHAEKLAHAACVIPVTRPLAERVKREGWMEPARVHVITMGVDTERFSPADAPRGDPPQVLTVARLNKTKGVQFALEALAKLRVQGLAFRYTVLGEGPYRGELAALVEQLGLSDAVDLPGTASQDEVLAALRRASVFALTSFGKGEAAPVSVMEAMSTGVPVVVSRIGGSPDMIDHGVDGFLVEQQDSEGIASAFRELLASAERRASVGAAARARAERDFDYRVLAERVLAVIRSSVDGAG